MGTFTRAIGRGVDTTQMTLYGFAEWMGKLTGIDVLEEWGEEGVARNIREIQENPAEVESWDDIDSLADFGNYLIEALGEGIPSIATTVAGGGVGGYAAKKIMAARIGKTVQRQLGSKAFKATDVFNQRQAAAIRKGQIAGALALGGSQNIGETQINFDLENEGQNSGSIFLTGAIKGALDVMPVSKLLKLTKNTGLPPTSLAEGLSSSFRAAREVGLSEALTESAQTFVDQVALGLESPTYDVFNYDNLSEIIDSGLKGGIAGGGIAATVQGGKNILDVYERNRQQTMADMAAIEQSAIDEVLNEIRPVPPKSDDEDTGDTIPEPADTVRAQVQAVDDPTSTKDVAFFEPGSDLTPLQDPNIRADIIEKPDGSVYVTNNKDKADFIRSEHQDTVRLAHGELLYDKPEGKEGTDGTVVVAEDARGQPVSEIVSSPESLEQDAATAQGQAPEGGRVVVSNANQQIEQRINAAIPDPQLRKRTLAALTDPTVSQEDKQEIIRFIATESQAANRRAEQTAAIEQEAGQTLEAPMADELAGVEEGSIQYEDIAFVDTEAKANTIRAAQDKRTASFSNISHEVIPEKDGYRVQRITAPDILSPEPSVQSRTPNQSDVEAPRTPERVVSDSILKAQQRGVSTRESLQHAKDNDTRLSIENKLIEVETPKGNKIELYLPDLTSAGIDLLKAEGSTGKSGDSAHRGIAFMHILGRLKQRGYKVPKIEPYKIIFQTGRDFGPKDQRGATTLATALRGTQQTGATSNIDFNPVPKTVTSKQEKGSEEITPEAKEQAQIDLATAKEATKKKERQVRQEVEERAGRAKPTLKKTRVPIAEKVKQLNAMDKGIIETHKAGAMKAFWSDRRDRTNLQRAIEQLFRKQLEQTRVLRDDKLHAEALSAFTKFYEGRLSALREEYKYLRGIKDPDMFVKNLVDRIVKESGGLKLSIETLEKKVPNEGDSFRKIKARVNMAIQEVEGFTEVDIGDIDRGEFEAKPETTTADGVPLEEHAQQLDQKKKKGVEFIAPTKEELAKYVPKELPKKPIEFKEAPKDAIPEVKNTVKQQIGPGKWARVQHKAKDLNKAHKFPLVKEFFSAGGRLRVLAPELADMIEQVSNTARTKATGVPFYAARQASLNQWNGGLFDIHAKYTKGKDAKEVKHMFVTAYTQLAMELPDTELSPMAKDLRAYNKKFYDEYLKPNIPTIGEIKNHFPRTYNVEKILEDPTAFMRVLGKHGIEKPEEVLKSITENESVSPLEDMSEGRLASRLSSLNRHRRFTAPDMVRDLVAGGFLNTDPISTFHSYLFRSITRGEYEKLFGEYGAIPGVLPIGNLNRLGVKGRANAVAENTRVIREWATIHGIEVYTREGIPKKNPSYEELLTTAKDWGYARENENGDIEWWGPSNKLKRMEERHIRKKFKQIEDKKLSKEEEAKAKQEYGNEIRMLVSNALGIMPMERDTMQAKFINELKAYEAMRVLLFSGVASIPEFGLSFMKNRGVLTIREYANVIGNTIKNRQDAEEFAYLLGIARDETAAAVASELFIDQGQKGWWFTRNLPKLFEYNGNNQVIHFSRALSSMVAREYIYKLERNSRNGVDEQQTNRYLKELGITPTQIRNWKRAGEPYWHRVDPNQHPRVYEAALAMNNAISAFVSESVLIPTHADRPVLANNIYGSMIFLVKSFQYKFNRLVTMGMIREYQARQKEGGNTLYPFMLMMLPMIGFMMLLGGLSDELRERIKSMGSKGTMDRHHTSGDMLKKWLDRSGLNSIPFTEAITGGGVDGLFFDAGPIASHAYDFILEDKPVGHKVLSSVPGFSQLPGARKLVYNGFGE